MAGADRRMDRWGAHGAGRNGGNGAVLLQAIDRGRRIRRLVLAASGVAFACVPALFLLAPDRGGGGAAPARENDRPAFADDVRSARDRRSEAGAELLDPAPIRPDRFRIVFAGRPGDMCAEIGRLGIAMSDWSADPLKPGRWQCSSDLVPVGPADERGRRSSIFVSLRGDREDRIDFLRIKLNCDNPAAFSGTGAAAMRVLDAIAARYGWEWPPALRRSIDEGRTTEIEQRGMRLAVYREDPRLTNDSDRVLRLNVVLDFPDHALKRASDGFRPFSWRKSAGEQ